MLAQAQSFVRAALAMTVSCAALLGCERKAPGPDECARFAAAVVQHATGGEFMTREMQHEVEDQTRECLTRPYDRELLNCVLLTNRARPCLEAFRQRTGRAKLIGADPS